MLRRARCSFDTVFKYLILLIQTPKYHKSNKTHLKVKRNMKKARVTNVLLHCRLQSIFRLFNIHQILPGSQPEATCNWTLCDHSVATTKTMQKIEMMNFEENESMEKLWQASEVALPKVKKQAIFSAQLCSSSFVGWSKRVTFWPRVGWSIYPCFGWVAGKQ